MKRSWLLLQEDTAKKIHPQNKEEPRYDIWDDWDLIESSFRMQYGIQLRDDGPNDISYEEFISLLGGIMPDTPLGRVVAIRSEKDPKVLKQFTKEQKKIRNDWIRARNKKLKEDPVKYKQYVENLQNWARSFKKKEGE